MKAKEKTRMRSLAVAGAAAFVLFCGNARGQVTQQQQMPPRVRTQVSGQQTPQQRALKPAPLKNITDYSGKISGVVYWDTTKVVRNTEATLVDLENKTETTVAVPPGCDGTAVYVWITDQTAQWGAWQASTSTLSYSVDGSLARCAYTIDRVPTGQALSVAAYVPSEDYSFKTGMTNYGDMAAVPAPGDKATWWYTWGGGVGGVGTSITVVNTPCRDLISSTSISSASGPRSCGGQATNVNFIIGSYSGYLNSLFSSSGGSSQQLSATQARAVPQTVRLRQTLSRGALTTQSPRPTKAAAGGQQISALPSNARLTNPGPQQTPMLGTPAEPLLANGSQPGTLAAQTPGATSANPASGERTTMSAAGATVTRAALTPTNGGSQPGAAPVPSKGHEHNAYDAVTVQRGVTNDPNFTKWAHSTQDSNKIAGTSPARGAVLTSNQALAGPCTGSGLMVSALRFEFTTGKDDLRGGDNNLDIEVHFKNNTFQPAQNVNKSANWPNGSVNRVDVALNQPVREDQIAEIHLVHNAQASFPNSQDNWEITQVRVLATGQGKTENIANYGFNDFTGDNPELTVPVSCAPAPGMVNALYFDVVTGSDDLKGDSFNVLAAGPDGNNLDVIIGFSNGTTEHAPNVNGGANWANNTEHKFFVYLGEPVDVTEIRSITLQTVLQRFGTDKWNMNSAQVTAVGNGVNKLIATHGFYRFDENASLSLDMVTH